jgi:CelD/BcsL family acetyltransferase involved in cellulose biosynthesis
MVVYRIDPLRDSRWDDFVRDHTLATVFHSVEWLRALKHTYGYEPIALSTSPSTDSLKNGLVFCRVSSWLTGVRYVSLPFSDHCDVLASGPDDTNCLIAALAEHLDDGLKYAEIRPLSPLPGNRIGLHETQEFCFHELDLRPSLDELFRRFHKDSTQRKIRRAEREDLSFEEGRSETVLDSFYRLLVITRRRHGLPPPPRSWFKNLIDCLGDQLMIRVASKEGKAIAAMLTVRFKDTLVYKYGGSDSRFNALGGMHALFWRAIQDAKREGLRRFDLGRSDLDNQGLITFKDRWGAMRLRINYFRYVSSPSRIAGSTWNRPVVKRVLAHMPNSVLSTAGKLLYKHVG